MVRPNLIADDPGAGKTGEEQCAEPGCLAAPQTRGRCESHYRRRIRMGLCGYRDAERARQHVAALRSLGWTWEGIAEAASLSTYVAHRLNNGSTHRLLPESEEALLKVPLIPYGSHNGIDSTGTRRRVQALAWMGWPCGEVARRAGTTERSLSTLIQPSRQISHRLALRVAEVYESLCMTTGPSKIAASKARSAGHAPPLAWEPDTIDHPDGRPNLKGGTGWKPGRRGGAA